MFWKDVAKTNCANTDKDKVEGFKIRPILPLTVDGSTKQDVDNSDDYGDDWRKVKFIKLVIYDNTKDLRRFSLPFFLLFGFSTFS